VCSSDLNTFRHCTAKRKHPDHIDNQVRGIAMHEHISNETGELAPISAWQAWSFTSIARRHKCQRPGCDHTRYLEIHHKIYRSRGGTNDPSNLTCLCSACHALTHEKRGFQVKSPPGIYEWRATDWMDHDVLQK